MAANFIATPARIRRIKREAEYARVVAPGILAARPDAQDGYDDVRESFFDYVADAQVLIEELHDGALGFSRDVEQAETDTSFSLGNDVPLTPTLPQAQMIDRRAGFNGTMIIKGASVDFHTQRHAIEGIG
jgi:hypothetical protein